MARPRKVIDEALLENLAKIHCTNDEMANILGCSKDTLEKRFSATIKRGRDAGKLSLRRKLFQQALERDNMTALIWLSKQHLGMRDTPVEEITKEQFQDFNYKIKWGSVDESREETE